MSGFWYGKKVSKLTCRVTHNFLWVDSGSVCVCVWPKRDEMKITKKRYAAKKGITIQGNKVKA